MAKLALALAAVALLCHAWAIEPSQKEVTSLGDAKSHAAAGKVLNHKKVVSKKKAPAPVDPRAVATQRLVQVRCPRVRHSGGNPSDKLVVAGEQQALDNHDKEQSRFGARPKGASGSSEECQQEGRRRCSLESQDREARRSYEERDALVLG